ncbi:MAG: UDP-N-acetylenolpyruvoylglucosamine reductase [Planctomycetaceae bacterium]|nr:UDP-N-acetylenolpyruvoylglucosamine reductase [Planctomycetaceae bacterium]
MSSLDDFADIIERDKPLAPLTWLKTGGNAEFYAEPQNEQQLTELVSCCHENSIAVHLLGGGSNILVRDETVAGLVIRLVGDAFSAVSVSDTVVQAQAGALLSNIMTESVKAGLAGLETLAGIPGTLGGALKGNAGGRSGDVGQFVQSVSVLTVQGEKFTRSEDELTFAYRQSSINELVILDATFQLERGDADEITRRMRKLWIMKKATQPLTFQSAGCIFKNPRGLSAGALIERAGLKGTSVGSATISERHANFIVTEEGTKAEDILQLVEMAREKVDEQFGVDLELEIQIW